MNLGSVSRSPTQKSEATRCVNDSGEGLSPIETPLRVTLKLSRSR